MELPSQEAMKEISEVLNRIRDRGIRLWAENGRLRYRAPKGALAEDEIQKLGAHKGQIVALLEQCAGSESSEPRLELRHQRDRAPLTYSQLAHWYLYRLNERPSLCWATSAMRLSGELRIDKLRQSIAEIVKRHEALRTRIAVLDGVVMQEISPSLSCEPIVDDLTQVPEESREREIEDLLENHVFEEVDVTVGPLFWTRLMLLSEREHVFVVAMEHIISDGFSLNVLLRDIFLAYSQLLEGRELSLPEIPMQFADYAVWQRNSERSWLEAHGAYWDERLRGCERLRFPPDEAAQSADCPGWGIVPIRIGRGLRTALVEWSRIRQTTLALTVFAAFAGLALRWCRASEAVFLFQIDGRNSPKVENTIGYFASALYLRLELREHDRFIDLIKRATVEYCNAYEHADASYLEAQLPVPEIAKNPRFNWLPQGHSLDRFGPKASADAIVCTHIPFVHPMQHTLDSDGEPMIGLVEIDDEVIGNLQFPLNRYSIAMMQRFANNFAAFVNTLLNNAGAEIADISLV